MNNTNRDQELLDLITQDDLNEDTRAEVVSRSIDPVFELKRKKALAFREVIIESTHNSLKEELRTFDKELILKKQNRKKVLLAIATLIVLTLTALLFNLSSNDKEVLPNELFAMYYTPHPNAIDPLTKGTIETSLSATQQYELGEYDKTIKMLDASNLDATSTWYLAQAHLANQNWNKASQQFSNIIEQGGKYSSNAKWFMALIYLREGNLKSAKTLLQDVASNSDNGYALKAKDLLSEL